MRDYQNNVQNSRSMTNTKVLFADNQKTATENYIKAMNDSIKRFKDAMDLVYNSA
jgi:hypothetical protein